MAHSLSAATLAFMWHERLHERCESIPKAVGMLFPRWKKQAPKEVAQSKSTPAALENRLRSLHRQPTKVEWWNERPVLRRLLAELLSMEDQEIFSVPESADGALRFADFPRLPPLSPDEERHLLNCSWWLGRLVLQQLAAPSQTRRPRMVWVQAAPGTGKSLTTEVLRRQFGGDVECCRVPTLAEVEARAGTPLALVVEIETPCPEEDVRVLQALGKRQASTFVLAPFGVPVPTWAAPDSQFGVAENGWETIEFRLPEGWRRRVLSWVSQRIQASPRETNLDEAELLQWMDRSDPAEQLFSTPSDVIGLCADADVHGTPSESPEIVARRWFDSVAAGLLPRECPPSWAIRCLYATYHSMLLEHLTDTGKKLGSLDSHDWAPLVSRELTPAVAGDTPGQGVVVQYLREAGLLKGDKDGLAPSPGWVASALMMAKISERIAKEDFEGWGVLAADTSRQRLVDAALDRCTDELLFRQMRTLSKRTPPTSLASLAAVESTIAAVGRRLDQSPLPLTPANESALQRLMMWQLDALLPTLASPPTHHPFTRRDADEWFATGWAVSFRTHAPEGFRSAQLSWELPGWFSELSFDNLPELSFPSSYFASPSGIGPVFFGNGGEHVKDIDHRKGSKWVVSPFVRRMARHTSRVMRRVRLDAPPKKVPRLLLPAFLVEAGTDPSLLLPTHLAKIGNSWEEALFPDQAKSMPHEKAATLAARIWSLVAHAVVGSEAVPVSERIVVLHETCPLVAEFVLLSLPAAEVRKVAVEYGTHRRPTTGQQFSVSNPLALAALPELSRREALLGWLERAGFKGTRFDEARELVPLLQHGDLDLAFDLARAGDKNVAAEFMSFLWTHALERARQEAELTFERGLPVAEAWFRTAPREELGRLADVISGVGAAPTWARDWAINRSVEAGVAAERLFSIAKATAAPSKLGE